MASAAPALAASTEPIRVVIKACKSAPAQQAGWTTYSVDLSVTNTLSVPLTFENVVITDPSTFSANPIAGQTINGGQTALFGFSFNGPTGQGNPVISVKVSYYLNNDSSTVYSFTDTYTLQYNEKGCTVTG